VAGRGEELVEERGDGGLAVRAGDADDDQRGRWATVDLCRKVGQRARGIVDAEVRDTAVSQERRDLALQFLRADDGGASRSCGVGHERVSIGSRAWAGDEERAGADGPRVGDDAFDPHVAVILRDRRDQLGQSHP
jgi:hypothetical protein